MRLIIIFNEVTMNFNFNGKFKAAVKSKDKNITGRVGKSGKNYFCNLFL